MINILQKDKKTRCCCLKKENIRNSLKYLCYNRFLNLSTRWFLRFEFEKLLRQSSFLLLKNRCVRTFWLKTSLRGFRFSRLEFRIFARSGKIFGLVKEN